MDSLDARLRMARQHREAIMDHYSVINDATEFVNGGHGGIAIPRSGSATDSPPGTDDGRWSAEEQDEHSPRRETDEPKPHVSADSMDKSHPGQMINKRQITDRDQRWITSVQG